MHELIKSDRTGAANKPEVVVITGASAGVGRATIREFAKNGAHVGLLARGRDGLESVALICSGGAVLCQPWS